jgi:phytol kinase
MLHNNLLAFIITLALSVIWLRFVGYATVKHWIPSTISRKVIHIGTGPLFVACWVLFDASVYSRYIAAIVPLISTVQFFLAGIGKLKDRGSIESMSRSGDYRELLRGPFLYGIAFILITLVFWLNSPVGVVALMTLCGGDGLADIFGKKCGRKVLPWSAKKTWAGSLAMFAGGYGLSALIVGFLALTGNLSINFTIFLAKLAGVVLVSTIVESVSRSDVDNITVPVAAIVTGLLLNI